MNMNNLVKKAMRNMFIKATAVVSCTLVLLSCNKELEKATLESGPVEYTCRIVNPETRTVLSDNVVTWEVNDQLGFYTSTNTNNTYQKITTISPEVQFKVYLSSALAADDELYAYFPYKSNSNAATDGPTKVLFEIPTIQTNDFDAMPQVSKVFVADAQTTSGSIIDLEFINLGSIAQFLVFSEDETIRTETVNSITFEANKACAGSFTHDISSIDYDTPSTLAISGYTETAISVNASPSIGASKADAGVVNMILAPGAYTGTINVFTSDATYVFNINSEMTFARAHKKPLGLKLDAAHRVSLPKKTFAKITTAPDDWTAKEYILVNSDANVVMTGQLTGNYLEAAAVTPNAEGTITCLASYAITFENVSDGFHAIKNSDGQYIALKQTGSNNASLSNGATTIYEQFALSLSATGLATINSRAQNTRYLTYQSGKDWRFYADLTDRGYLYELIDSREKLTTPVITAEVSGSTITASWTSIPNAGNYVATLSNGTTETVTNPTVTFTGLTAGVYTVSVIAKPSNTENYLDSEEGVSNSVIVGTPTLAKPTISSFSQTSSGFSASIVKGDDYATSYSWMLYEGTVNDDNVVGMGNTTALAFSADLDSDDIDITEFTDGTTYYLIVTAEAAGFVSAASDPASFEAESSVFIPVVVWDDDFSRFTKANTTAMTSFQGSKTDFTDSYTAEYCYAEVGSVKLSSSKNKGWLQTPTFNRLTETSKVSVTVEYAGYGSDGGSLNLSVSGGGTLSSSSLTATNTATAGASVSTWDSATFTITGATSSTQLKIQASKRFFINSIYIVTVEN